MDNVKHYPTHPGAEQPPIMKCDKLKAEPMIINDDYTALYYPKESVDAAIAELKAENRKLKHALWLARAHFCARSCEFFSGIMSHCLIGKEDLYNRAEKKKNK